MSHNSSPLLHKHIYSSQSSNMVGQWQLIAYTFKSIILNFIDTASIFISKIVFYICVNLFIYLFIYLFICLFIFVFSRAAPPAYGGSQARIQLELQPPGYAKATATQDPSRVCVLHHSSQQHQILNSLSEARDRILNLMVPSRIR